MRGLSAGNRRGRRRGRGDRGAAAVELALTLPLLLLIVCGIIDFGRMFNAQITLTEAAREGARAAAVSGTAAAVKKRVDLATSGVPGVQPPATTFCSPTRSEAEVDLTYNFSYVTPFAMIAGMFGDGPDGTVVLTATGVMSC
ncbi:MAG TPA: TadE/TadG family type IV pilus assembly protein [Micromonosporaceae bacterium]|nr:TadE/TadG family type IV pilus assembly protein [Micromonosporaceae bacterium]